MPTQGGRWREVGDVGAIARGLRHQREIKLRFCPPLGPIAASKFKRRNREQGGSGPKGRGRAGGSPSALEPWTGGGWRDGGGLRGRRPAALRLVRGCRERQLRAGERTSESLCRPGPRGTVGSRKGSRRGSGLPGAAGPPELQPLVVAVRLVAGAVDRCDVLGQAFPILSISACRQAWRWLRHSCTSPT